VGSGRRGGGAVGVRGVGVGVGGGGRGRGRGGGAAVCCGVVWCGVAWHGVCMCVRVARARGVVARTMGFSSLRSEVRLRTCAGLSRWIFPEPPRKQRPRDPPRP
jgi:hypothetical protein